MFTNPESLVLSHSWSLILLPHTLKYAPYFFMAVSYSGE